MFCKNCGAEVNDTARFCPKCGNSRGDFQQRNEIVEDNQIRFALKPEFNILYELINTVCSGLIILFIIAVCITGFPLLMEFPILTIGFLVIYVLIKMIFGNMQYKCLSYNFYKTKIEYIDGFLNREEKELKYKFVREVTMSQSVFERIFGIGTIKIFTNASSGGYNGNNHGSMKGRNGIYIHCIENVQEQYRIIRQIIEEGTQD